MDRGSCSSSACDRTPSRGEGGLTPLLPPEQPEERREPALRGVANHAHRGGVVADVLFGALLHSTRLRPGLDLADAELSLRLTLDLGVAGEVTQGGPSVTQQLHAPMIGAQTDMAAVLGPSYADPQLGCKHAPHAEESVVGGVIGRPRAWSSDVCESELPAVGRFRSVIVRLLPW